MKIVQFYLVLISLSFLSLDSLSEITETLSSAKRIVGGDVVVDNLTATDSVETTEISQWPWMTALIKSNSQFCGASLIDRYWLLTAAHCVYDSSTESGHIEGEITAQFLQSNLEVESVNGFERTINQIIIHSNYDYDKDTNDIALLKLSTPVDSISPILLPTANMNWTNLSTGTLATVLGWGDTQDSSDSSRVLRKVQIPIVEQSVCEDSFNTYGIKIEKSMLCAGYKVGDKDSCAGDSGGPLVYYSDVHKDWVQAGIVSFGIGCAVPNLYGVYTRVSKYTLSDQLIVNNICNELPETPEIQVTNDNQNFTLNFVSSNKDSNFIWYASPLVNTAVMTFAETTGSSYKFTYAKRHDPYLIFAQNRRANCFSYFSKLKIINL